MRYECTDDEYGDNREKNITYQTDIHDDVQVEDIMIHVINTEEDRQGGHTMNVREPEERPGYAGKNLFPTEGTREEIHEILNPNKRGEKDERGADIPGDG